MKTAVFLDLDGTLWEWGVVPDSAREAIRRAQANGHKILTNTGRARSEVPDLSYLGLDGFCFAAGAEVILDGRTIVNEPLPEALIHQVAAVFDSFGLNYSLESGTGSWISRPVSPLCAKRITVARLRSKARTRVPQRRRRSCWKRSLPPLPAGRSSPL